MFGNNIVDAAEGWGRLSLQRLPFRDFTAEEFLGRTLTTCRGAGGTEPLAVASGYSFARGTRSLPQAVLYRANHPSSSARCSGRMCGNLITSRIDCLLASSITSRSMPMPIPAAGGIP